MRGMKQPFVSLRRFAFTSLLRDWSPLALRHLSEVRGLSLPALVFGLFFAGGLGKVCAGQEGDPLMPSEVRALTAPDGASSAYFGSAVSVSGSFAAVGAYGALSGRGAVYIFERNQGGADEWQMVRKITVSDGANGDHFGFSVSLSGSMLAVGAPDNNQYGSDAGLVYVFERNLGGADQWGMLCKVASSDLTAGDHFGYSVSLDLNLLAVGAYGEKPGGVSKGAAYVFHMNYGSGWFGQVAQLLASDGAAGDQFGTAVSISGDRVVVGAHMDNNEHGTGAGAAYLFARDHGGYNHWGEVRKFTGESEGDHYGRAVAIYGPTILLGAPDSTEGGAFGRAYVYERNQGGPDAWAWVKTLIGGTALGCKFGGAVALGYDKALVGASMEKAGGVMGGSVIVFGRDSGGSGNWGRLSEVVAEGRAANDYFGAAVALDGNVAVIGAHGDDPSGSSSGSARLFRWTGNRWYFEAKLTNSHPAFSRSADLFGASVALEHGWLAAGAPRPRGWTSYLQGSGGAPTVTMFRRRPPGQVTSWGVGQNVIYDDVGGDDSFGTAVAMSGDKLVVGAPGDQAGNGYPRGMSYFFERNQGGADAWGQVRKSNQHNRHNFEEVGKYVAIEGDTTVLGSSGVFKVEDASWGEWWEYLDLWDDDMVATGGNTYMYGRDEGGQSAPWAYLRRFPYWDKDQVVALSGNTLAVGILNYDGFGGYWDDVRVYGRNYGGKDSWGLVQLINSPAEVPDDGFGGSIALDGDTLAVGPRVKRAEDNVSSLPEDDSIFIYKRNSGGADAWGLVREIHVGTSFKPVGFGAALALSGDVLVVGTPGQSNLAGAVFLFERNVGGADKWGLVHQFRAPVPWEYAWFGQSLAMKHGVLAVGAPGDDRSVPSPTGSFIVQPRAGAVYVFSQGNNRAPVMANPATNSLLYLNEDATAASGLGTRVSSLTQRSQMADADGDVCGIAVIAANNASGQWQYSIDGSAWFNLQVDPDMARVLDPRAWIRFIPATNFNGTVQPGLTYRAWDQTVWGTGGLAYASKWGGNTCFSEQTSLINCEVAPVNDRPVLTSGASPQLPDIYGNILSPYNRGLAVSNLITGLVTDADGDACGIAVTSVLNANGDWQYSLDAGATWRSFIAPTAGGARLLGPADKVRFMPARNFSGSVANGLVFAAWDGTHGTSGGIAGIQTSTAFSVQTIGCGITVTPVVNHAPVLDIFGEPSFPVISQGATVIEGARVSDLLTNWVEDVDGDLCGIALGQADPTYGAWEYSLDDGVHWQPVGTVSFDESLLLGPDARLRFLPVPDYAGTIQLAVLYRAWDRTVGVEGTKVTGQIAGGHTSLSIGIEVVPLTVSSLGNHAPLLDNSEAVFLTPVQESETDPFGDLVADLIEPVVTDRDGDACGIAIFGMTLNYGYWEYSLGKSAIWVRLGEVSSKAARLLGPGTRLRFIPQFGFTGTVTNGLEFRAWDRSAGTNGGIGSLTLYGGSTPFSGRTGKIGVKVEPVNRAPRLLVPAVTLTSIVEGQYKNPGDIVSNLLERSVADPDGDACGIAVVQIPDAQGAWQYSLNGGTNWTTMSTWRLNYGRLLGPSARVRFVPDPGYSGQVTNGFQFAAWDQSSGVPGALAYMPRTGGGTAFSSDSGHVEIRVVEANRPPIAVTLIPASVTENQPARTVVGILGALDPNAGDSHTFALVSGSGDDDNDSFVVISNRLATARVFDREFQSDYVVRLQARDAQGASFARPVMITVEDLNDSAPTDVALNPFAVSENRPAGTVVGTLTTSDPDLDPHHTFTLVAGDGDVDNASFAIQGNTLVTTRSLDFESGSVCYVRVQVDDGRNPPYQRSLPISIVDEEESSPPYDLVLLGSCLMDGSPANTPVGVLRAMDRNLGDTLTFSLVDGEGADDNHAFKVGDRILFTTADTRFGSAGAFRIRVQVDDGKGGRHQESFRIVPAVPIWTETFESGWGQWTHPADQGSDSWQITDRTAHSPTHSLSVAVNPEFSDSSAVSPWIEVPAGAGQLRFEFQHRYDWGTALEEKPDAGVLEWRRLDEPWQDLLMGEAGTTAIFGGYDVVLVPAASDHPLAGQPVWGGKNGEIFAPFAASLNTGFLAGQKVQFRWRQVASSGILEHGWHIDDIVLSAVQGTNTASGFKISSLQITGTALALEWQSVPGQTCVIEMSSDPGKGTWTPAGDPITSGSTGASTKKTLDLTTLPGYPHRALYFRMRYQ